MAKKSRNSPLEDLMNLVAMLPWWVGVALALVFYLVLHHFSVAPKPVALVKPAQVSEYIRAGFIAQVALVGQFLLPILCLCGALTSFLRRKKRQDLLSDVTQSNGAQALDGMSWREFEMLVGEAFSRQGYRVSELGGRGADGGVDLVLTKGGETFLVQCKQWKAFKVGVDVVRELYGVMAARGAAGGYVITSGRFTADAQAFASGRNVKLFDGPKLLALIKDVKAEHEAETAPAPLSMRPQAAASPACPSCGAAMVLRTAKKGANAGKQFWGCSTYPACRGTR
ncbi:MAG: restriction endonuclease [Ramlibacter sp.]|nr:restriction endonuclease [Ramlibacter sp.]